MQTDPALPKGWTNDNHDGLPPGPLYLGLADGTRRGSYEPTLGGLPEFQQEPQWPACPTCPRLMRYVGQLPSGGGVAFAYLCPGCLVATWRSDID